MNLRNEVIKEIVAEIPEGHRHLRVRLTLQDGSEFIFQEEQWQTSCGPTLQ